MIFFHAVSHIGWFTYTNLTYKWIKEGNSKTTDLYLFFSSKKPTSKVKFENCIHWKVNGGGGGGMES